MKNLRLSLLCAAILLPLVVLVAQFDPAYNQPPTSLAVDVLQRAALAECKFLYTQLPATPLPFPQACGRIDLFRNASLTFAGFTFADGPLHSSVIYNPQRMNQIVGNFGGDAAFGVFAHEVGHHMDAHFNRMSWIDNQWNKEVRADAWAGCALAIEQMSTDGLETATKVLAAYPSPMNPPVPQHIAAIRTGYIACGGKFADVFNRF
jgi:hypothetical protein